MVGDETETPLGGGFVNNVVRVGGTVRRRLARDRPFARELLGFLERAGWPGAPRFLGVDDDGREVLSYIDGHVPWSGVDEPPGVYDEGAVAGVARLLRGLHDLTAGSALAGEEEVVCHNDVNLSNTVYREQADGLWRPVALIDWDLAGPGQRLQDLGHLGWHWAAGTTSSPDAAVHLLRVAADSYGVTEDQRRHLVEAVLWWQDRTWRGIQQGIDAGDPAMARLEAAGAVGFVRADWEWTMRHRAALEAGLYG